MSVSKKILVTTFLLALLMAFVQKAEAKSTFLPDWQQAGLTFGVDTSGDQNKDENYCKEAEKDGGGKFYHKDPTCPKPKDFDETCPMDETYISDCYCDRNKFPYTCSSPFRGDTRVKEPKSGYANCDNFWVSCCDETCPAGTSRTNPGGCGGSTANGCGDRCYYPYQPCCYPDPDETGCGCGTYTCGDGCGGYRKCCNSCCSGCECDNSCNSSSGGSSGDSSSNSSGGGSSNSGSGSGTSSGPKTGRVWFEPTNKWICWNANTSTQCSDKYPYAMVQDVHEWCDCGGGIHEYDRGMHAGYKSSDCYATLAECNAGTFHPKTNDYLSSSRCTCG